MKKAKNIALTSSLVLAMVASMSACGTSNQAPTALPKKESSKTQEQFNDETPSDSTPSEGGTTSTPDTKSAPVSPDSTSSGVNSRTLQSSPSINSNVAHAIHSALANYQTHGRSFYKKPAHRVVVHQASYQQPAITATDTSFVQAQARWASARAVLADAENQLNQAKANLTSKEGILAQARKDNEQAVLAQAQAQDAYDRINAQTDPEAKANLETAQKALDSAKKDADAKLNALTLAEGAYKSAFQAQANAQATLTKAQLDVESSQASLDKATDRYAKLSADISVKSEALSKAQEAVTVAQGNLTPKQVAYDSAKKALESSTQALSKAQSNLAVAKQASKNAHIDWDKLSINEKIEMTRVLFLEMLNQYRELHGLKPVVMTDYTNKQAQWWADYPDHSGCNMGDKAYLQADNSGEGVSCTATDPNHVQGNSGSPHSNLSLARYNGEHDGMNLRITGENADDGQVGHTLFEDSNPLFIAAGTLNDWRNSPAHNGYLLSNTYNVVGLGFNNDRGFAFMQGYQVFEVKPDAKPAYSVDPKQAYGIDVKDTTKGLDIMSVRPTDPMTHPEDETPYKGTVSHTPTVDPAFSGKVDISSYQSAVSKAQETHDQAQGTFNKASADYTPVKKAYDDAQANLKTAQEAMNASSTDKESAKNAVAVATSASVNASKNLENAKQAVSTAKKTVETTSQAVKVAQVQSDNASKAVQKAINAVTQAEKQVAPLVQAETNLSKANQTVDQTAKAVTTAKTQVKEAQQKVATAQQKVATAQQEANKASADLGTPQKLNK